MDTRKKLLIIVALLVLGAGGFITFRIQNKKTPPVSVLQKTYVALGDSVAAGVGLETASDTTACYRYKEGYPQVLADSLTLRLTNLSCSGASIDAGL